MRTKMKENWVRKKSTKLKEKYCVGNGALLAESFKHARYSAEEARDDSNEAVKTSGATSQPTSSLRDGSSSHRVGRQGDSRRSNAIRLNHTNTPGSAVVAEPQYSWLAVSFMACVIWFAFGCWFGVLVVHAYVADNFSILSCGMMKSESPALPSNEFDVSSECLLLNERVLPAAVEEVGGGNKTTEAGLESLFRAAIDGIDASFVAAETLPNNTVDDVVSILLEHPEDATIQRLGLEFLFFLTGYERHRQALHDADGMDAALSATKHHIAVPKVQAYGAGILAKLADNATNAGIIVSRSSVPTVLSAMTTYPSDDILQHQGCLFLSKIAYHGFHDAIFDAEGHHAIVQAMQNHTEDSQIQFICIRALDQLASSYNLSLVATIANSGAVTAIVVAMKRYMDHFAIFWSGDRVISKLLPFQEERDLFK